MTVKLFFLCCVSLFQLNSQTNHVLYGERKEELTKHRLFLDRHGNLYPDWFISDTSLQKSHASLSEWYQNNQIEFLKISKLYHCHFNAFAKEYITVLNDSIAAFIVRKLNQTNSSSITLMIHGFRKTFKSYNSDTDSQQDFRALTKCFVSYYGAQSTILEVYWDGLYDCCFSANSKKNKYLFHLFEEAQFNAEKAGNRLKKINSLLKFDSLNILTYSLGAKVALYALLNISDSNSTTASNKRVNICMIAPAISPELIKYNYQKRSPLVDYSLNDNYVLSLVYNNKDFALKKKDNLLGIFGPGVYKYGNTSLGCNHKKSAEKLQAHFKNSYVHSKIRLYNLSKVGKCHLMKCYCDSDNLREVFTKLHQ